MLLSEYNKGLIYQKNTERGIFMKNKKRKTVIITLFSLFCLCGIIFTAIISSHNNQTDKYTLENTYNT